MSRRWAFRLEPNNNWFDAYAEQQYEAPDIAIITDPEDAMPNVQFISSPHFDRFVIPPMPQGVAHEESVAASQIRDNIRRRLMDRAAALKLVFDGAFCMSRLGRYHVMSWSALFELPDWQRHSWAPGDPMSDPFDRKVIGSRVLSPLVYNDISHLEDQLIYVARYDRVTLSILRALGRGSPTFVTLNNLLETMNTAGWHTPKVAAAAEVEKSEVNRVIATANNFGALGIDARHGDLGQKPYSDPIDLEEARAIVLNASIKFIAERAQLASQGLTQPF